MEIIKIIPQGFCKGVVNAIKMLNQTIKKDNYQKPLYMLGGIVHNKHIINAYVEKGVKVIDNIDNITSGTILITAHGISNKMRKQIMSKKLDIIDTTCIEVKKIQEIIKCQIREGYDVIYYGKENHPECKAILEDNPSIHLIQSINDIQNLSITNKRILFSSQTTASYSEIKIIEDLLLIKYPKITMISDICNATKIRQLALIEKAQECDLVLVIGDKLSNNSTRLALIANEFAKTILIENIEEIKNIDFSNIKKLGITAGASTPNILVDEIIKSIKDNNYISNLKDTDYINIKDTNLN